MLPKGGQLPILDSSLDVVAGSEDMKVGMYVMQNVRRPV
jgi:hypothetical protein